MRERRLKRHWQLSKSSWSPSFNAPWLPLAFLPLRQDFCSGIWVHRSLLQPGWVPLLDMNNHNSSSVITINNNAFIRDKIKAEQETLGDRCVACVPSRESIRTFGCLPCTTISPDKTSASVFRCISWRLSTWCLSQALPPLGICCHQ